MTPRVCVVSSLYHPALGGLGRQAQLLTERLHKEGVELFVIARKMSGMPEASFDPEVEVIRVPSLFPGVHILEEKSLRNLLISLSFSIGCLAELVRRRGRYDLVHFHGASLPLLIALPVLKRMGKRVIAKVAAANLGTEAGGFSGRYGFLGNWLARRVRKADAFVAISDEIRKGLLQDGVEEERIHRIPNFIDHGMFRPSDPGEKERLKSALGFEGGSLVLFAGRLVPRKGVDHLLSAWREIATEFRAARLHVLGDGPLQVSLQAEADRLGIASSVRFGGRVDNVPEYLRAADIFVLPSLQEGLSNSLLEAMASGLPVVATRIGGVVDVVTEGEDALLADAADPGDLAAGIRILLSDASLRKRIGDAAARTIEASYGLESRVQAYIGLYRNCWLTGY